MSCLLAARVSGVGSARPRRAAWTTRPGPSASAPAHAAQPLAQRPNKWRRASEGGDALGTAGLNAPLPGAIYPQPGSVSACTLWLEMAEADDQARMHDAPAASSPGAERDLDVASAEPGAALEVWSASPVPPAVAPNKDGPRMFKDAAFRSAALQAGGFAGLVLFWQAAPLAAFGSFLFGVGGGAVLRLARSDEAGRLDTTLRDGLERPARASKLLHHFAHKAGSQRMRLAARAWSALYAVEQGHLDEAVALYKRDDGWSRAWREGGVAPDAAVVPAILSWLVPTAFAPNSVPRRSMIRETRMTNAPLRTELLPSLLLMLGALEATAQGDRAFALRAVQRLDASTTRQQFPKLSLLVRAHVAKALPELRAEIDAELDDEARAFLARVMPTYARDGGAGIFRSITAPQRQLARLAPRAPEIVRERVEVAARLRGRERIARHLRVDGALRTGMWLSGGGFLLSAAMATPVGAGLSLAALASLHLARSVHLRVSRSRTRVGALLAVEGLTLPAWRKELDREFPTLIHKERYDGSAGAAQAAGALVQETFVSCALAERALRRGDLDEVESTIAWWFEGMIPEAIDPAVLRSCGASLVRLALVTDRDEAAAALLDVAESVAPSGWTRPWRASAYGGSKTALSLARALLAAKSGDWAGVAEALDRAPAPAWLAMWPRDQLVYAQLSVAARARGLAAPAFRTDESTAEDQVWLASTWPQLAG